MEKMRPNIEAVFDYGMGGRVYKETMYYVRYSCPKCGHIIPDYQAEMECDKCGIQYDWGNNPAKIVITATAEWKDWDE